MGLCASAPDRCLGDPSSSSSEHKNNKKKKNRTKMMKRRVSSRLSVHSFDDEPDVPDHSSHVSASMSVEETWFESAVALESDVDEDFQSVQEDLLSLSGRGSALVSCVASPKDVKIEGNPSVVLSSKMLLQRPIAGSQVPFSPVDKKILDSWSKIEPYTFRVRGQNYLQDKKKELASNHAAYHPFGADVFLSPKKVDHIARFLELPSVDFSGEIPSILVVNAQIPIYPPSLFQNEPDGEGFNIVLYFKLSENYLKELSSHFQENFRKLIDGAEEKIKSFSGDTVVPFRERLKILGRVVNIDDLPLNGAERKLMHAYNGKPLLSRPQHEFYLGKNYFEIDLDMHRFSYISRKGFDTFLDRLKLCVLDIGLTIQGNKVEELPEQILCCIRLNGIDYMNYQQLGLNYESLGL